MTTVVANKTHMASDSQAATADVKTSVKKIWRVRGWLIGVAGDYTEALGLIDNLKAIQDTSPLELLRSGALKIKASVSLLILSPGGKLYESENGGTPIPLSEGFGAIGTGSQGAMVAFHLGATPTQAIQAVRKVDPNTGGRVITRKL